MKQSFIILIFSLSLFACKNEPASKTRADEKNVIGKNEVPNSVINAFHAKYPAASEVIWEDAHEGADNTIKVKFKNNNAYWKAEYKTDGTLIKEKADD